MKPLDAETIDAVQTNTVEVRAWRTPPAYAGWWPSSPVSPHLHDQQVRAALLKLLVELPAGGCA